MSTLASLRALTIEEVRPFTVEEFDRKYRDLPMDLADAALVAVAERARITRIFTLDRRDFAVYRLPRLGV